ncbi:uncharacterized protein I303_107126 [Kwoniella dejecticola CBS 10117]|uniref:Uncharacterized protein n=1 Tax=Kwoniella dejecticola CBS 10117 TaxID=1296121 RepID=A0A1A5ZYU5_9TREE|nr:uncharacterized protein I303_06528 [Kwoniella dejecticola CBS 10117]OBR82970.1 hypothetical protein I303_06528 [Kwoniella dejecticola CBS 10117]
MPASLLGLYDHIIRQIAENLHNDDQINIPSFGPYWANFRSDINPDVHRDYAALRSTCRRMKDLCTLRDLHVRIKSKADLERLHNAPQQVLGSIKRMSVKIPHTPLPYPINSETILNQVREAENQTFCSLVQLLYRLPQLEELIIEDLQVCHCHIHHLSLPPHDFPVKLKSIAFEIGCKDCATHLERAIIPFVREIRYLKMTDCKRRMLPVLEEVTGHWNFQRQRQSQGQYQANQTPKPFPLKQLILKTEIDPVHMHLVRINAWCPQLEELYMTRYFVDEGNEMIPGFILAGHPTQPGSPDVDADEEQEIDDETVHHHTHQPDPIDMLPQRHGRTQGQRQIGERHEHGSQGHVPQLGEWRFHSLAESWVMRHDESVALVWKRRPAWDKFLAALSMFKHLKVIDCCIKHHLSGDAHSHGSQSELEPVEPNQVYSLPARTSLRASQYDRNLFDKMENAMISDQYDPMEFQKGMIAAAKEMIESCPTLEQGHFWKDVHLTPDQIRSEWQTHPYEGWQDCVQLWRRWTWLRYNETTPTDSEHGLSQSDIQRQLLPGKGTEAEADVEAGTEVLVVPIVEEFDEDWVDNTDGTLVWNEHQGILRYGQSAP